MITSNESLKVADQKGRVLLGSRYAGKRFSMREAADGSAVLTPVLVIPEVEGYISSETLAEMFAPLESLQNNWDGHGSPAPNRSVLDYAREILALFNASALARRILWKTPHLGCNERGQITLEWWYGGSALTIFVRSGTQVDYLKSWGSDIESEMEDGSISQISEFISLSKWLYQSTIVNESLYDGA